MATGLEIKQQRSFRPLKWLLRLLFLALIVAVGYYALIWYNTGELPFKLPIAAAGPSVDETPVTTSQRQAYRVSADQPRFVTISELGIKNARVAPIKLDQNKQLDTPKFLDDAGWYDKSAQPGQDYGAIVLTGHSEGKTRDGVFARLSSLKAGDEIKIERGDGKVFKYGVYDVHEMRTLEALKSGIPQAMQPGDDTKEGLSIMAE